MVFHRQRSPAGLLLALDLERERPVRFVVSHHHPPDR
jgi:hypothetical protein